MTNPKLQNLWFPPFSNFRSKIRKTQKISIFPEFLNFSEFPNFDKNPHFSRFSRKSEKNPKIQKFRDFPIFPIFTKSPFFPIFPKSEKTQKASRVKDFRFLSFFCKSRHSESNWSPLPLHPYPQESIDYCICQNFSEMAEKWESVTWEPT